MGEKIFVPELMKSVIDTLKNIFDPEMPVNIYDLGLIYDIHIEEGYNVKILMTLTNPNCPAAEKLPADVKKSIKNIEGVEDVDVNLTFEPPWSSDKMSEEAMLDMGLF